jgi:hypothetical protein
VTSFPRWSSAVLARKRFHRLSSAPGATGPELSVSVASILIAVL